MNILITGANGFIGSALCSRLSSDNKVIGTDILKSPDDYAKMTWKQADLTDFNSVTAICKKYSPDVVVHCAGIAHQKIGAVDSATYMRVNSEATENLAKTAAKSNTDVCFVFLSSVSVYGEHPQITPVPSSGATGQAQISQIKRTRTNDDDGVGEDGEYWPSSDYAVSKLDAERRLVALSDEGIIRNLIILRLAPVYDHEWSLNLDRRVFAPGKLAYLRFGSGSQRMSALARPNLVDFIVHILQSTDYLTQRRKDAKVKNNTEITQRRKGAKRGKISTTEEIGLDSGFRRNDKKEGENDKRLNSQIFNVCDAEPYEFNRIIRVFKKSGIRPDRPVISVPLSFVWVATRVAGILFSNKSPRAIKTKHENPPLPPFSKGGTSYKREWIHSCYDKLASDLVFDNGRMMGTGFRAAHSLETILSADYADYTD